MRPSWRSISRTPRTLSSACRSGLRHPDHWHSRHLGPAAILAADRALTLQAESQVGALPEAQAAELAALTAGPAASLVRPAGLDGENGLTFQDYFSLVLRTRGVEDLRLSGGWNVDTYNANAARFQEFTAALAKHFEERQPARAGDLAPVA